MGKSVQLPGEEREMCPFKIVAQKQLFVERQAGMQPLTIRNANYSLPWLPEE